MFLFLLFCFCLITKLLEFICQVFLAAKIKRYLHVLYMQLFNYLCIQNITYITHIFKYVENKNLKPYTLVNNSIV